MKATKYNYFRVIQQNYGGSWEDVSYYPCNSQGVTTEKSGFFRTLRSGRVVERTLLAYDVEQYRLTGYPTRVITRRELKS